MNSVSIFEKRWLDLVFEGKNKTYGAYQLRLENQRTTIFAFFVALLLLTTISCIPLVIGYFSGSKPTVLIQEKLTPVQLSDIKPDGPKPPTQAVVPLEKPTDIKDEKQLIDPEIVKSNEADDIAKNVDNTNTPEVVPDSGGGIVGKNPAPSNTGTDITPAKTGTEIEKMTSLDRLPEFPGGMTEFTRYIGKHFRTPDIEEEKILKVYLSFVIEKDGNITDIKVLRDPGYELGAEAVRVLKSMKVKWEPGLIAGKPVRTAYTLPITVKME